MGVATGIACPPASGIFHVPSFLLPEWVIDMVEHHKGFTFLSTTNY
jgi:hypothetical protein